MTSDRNQKTKQKSIIFTPCIRVSISRCDIEKSRLVPMNIQIFGSEHSWTTVLDGCWTTGNSPPGFDVGAGFSVIRS